MRVLQLISMITHHTLYTQYVNKLLKNLTFLRVKNMKVFPHNEGNKCVYYVHASTNTFIVYSICNNCVCVCCISTQYMQQDVINDRIITTTYPRPTIKETAQFSLCINARSRVLQYLIFMIRCSVPVGTDYVDGATTPSNPG